MQFTSHNLLCYLVLAVCCASLTHVSTAQALTEPITGAKVPCVDGKAAGFDCKDVELLSFLPISHISGVDHAHTHSTGLLAQHHECHDEGCTSGGHESVELNDIWGWTDPVTGKEYALVGRTEGTAFVDVSDPINPIYLGELPTRADTSTWRNIKVYQNYAFIVADYSAVSYSGSHGMQVFDLTQLRNAQPGHTRFTETAHYDGFGRSHNLFINEATGFAYAVGTETYGGGLHIVDVRNPLQPVFAGSFADARTGLRSKGYTHDVQCVVYTGPDSRYYGREICFGSNETALSIADVTNKAAPVAISATPYEEARYAHQGWLTPDQRYFLMDDELDEQTYGYNTRTIVWDVSDLQHPVVDALYYGTTRASDHNQYIVGGYSFQANYKSGLRVLDVSKMDTEAIKEVAYFDTYPSDDLTGFDGAWSNYPFFKSGTVVVSSIGQGLFVLKPTFSFANPSGGDEVPVAFTLASATPNPFSQQTTFNLSVPVSQVVKIAVYDMLGREVAVLHDGQLSAGTYPLTLAASTLPSGRYVVRATGAGEMQQQLITLVR